jgi:hypothetical protein
VGACACLHMQAPRALDSLMGAQVGSRPGGAGWALPGMEEGEGASMMVPTCWRLRRYDRRARSISRGGERLGACCWCWCCCCCWARGPGLWSGSHLFGARILCEVALPAFGRLVLRLCRRGGRDRVPAREQAAHADGAPGAAARSLLGVQSTRFSEDQTYRASESGTIREKCRNFLRDGGACRCCLLAARVGHSKKGAPGAFLLPQCDCCHVLVDPG